LYARPVAVPETEFRDSNWLAAIASSVKVDDSAARTENRTPTPKEENDMAIGIIARLKIQEGKNAEFEGIFLELQAAVKANEPGCNFYSLHKSQDDPQTYVVLEQYADEDSLKAHGGSDHFKTIGARMGPCMAGRPDLEQMQAV
jgi:quinol monooxygenase YgiN